MHKFITASEEHDESALSSCPSEDVSKGLMPRPFRAGMRERSEHKIGAGLCPAVNTLYKISRHFYFG